MKKEPFKIYIASDHVGFALKEKIKKKFLTRYELEDIGPFSFDKNDDYPDFIIPCAKKVASTKNSLGIVLGGSGQGEAIAANKVKGIRAVVIYSFNKKIIQLSKEHNNANVLSLGARFLTEKQALESIALWLKTPFSGEKRHLRRVEKIKRYEIRR